MKLKFALVGLVALCGAALTVDIASAMPLGPLGPFQASNVESVAVPEPLAEQPGPQSVFRRPHALTMCALLFQIP